MKQPAQIIDNEGRSVTIVWDDGTETVYSASLLRRSCPCAACVNEWTGERMLKEDDIPDDVTFSSLAIVGRYALNVRFSDGHETGIYSFNYLLGLPSAS